MPGRGCGVALSGRSAARCRAASDRDLAAALRSEAARSDRAGRAQDRAPSGPGRPRSRAEPVALRTEHLGTGLAALKSRAGHAQDRAPRDRAGRAQEPSRSRSGPSTPRDRAGRAQDRAGRAQDRAPLGTGRAALRTEHPSGPSRLRSGPASTAGTGPRSGRPGLAVLAACRAKTGWVREGRAVRIGQPVICSDWTFVMFTRALVRRFPVLANRNFRLLLADRLLAPMAATFSLVGVSFAVLDVTQIHCRPVLRARRAAGPSLIFLLVGGVIADRAAPHLVIVGGERHDRRRRGYLRHPGAVWPPDPLGDGRPGDADRQRNGDLLPGVHGVASHAGTGGARCRRPARSAGSA